MEHDGANCRYRDETATGIASTGYVVEEISLAVIASHGTATVIASTGCVIGDIVLAVIANHELQLQHGEQRICWQKLGLASGVVAVVLLGTSRWKSSCYVLRSGLCAEYLSLPKLVAGQ